MPALVLAMMIQAAAVAGPDIRYAAKPAPRRTEPVKRCSTSAEASGDIVVCAQPVDQRLPKLDDERFAPKPPTATFRLAGANGGVAAEQHELPGATGPAAKVTLTWHFGRGKKR